MKYELAAIVLAILASPFWQPVYYNAHQHPTSLDWLEMVVGWGFFCRRTGPVCPRPGAVKWPCLILRLWYHIRKAHHTCVTFNTPEKRRCPIHGVEAKKN